MWLVAGVWTVRAVAGGPIGLAWGLAAVGAAIRWGTLGLADLEVATRVAGPTLLSGPVVVRAGMAAALAGAVLGEAKGRTLLARTWGERAAAGIAIVALAPLYCVRGPVQPLSAAAGWWVAAAAGLAAITLLAGRLSGPIPGWAPIVLAASGVAVAVLGS